jgi:hypothetical protein
MPKPPSDPRWSVGSKPANRRTAAKAEHASELAPELQQRQHRLRSRHLLGRPLMSRLAAGPQQRAPLPRQTLVGALLGTTLGALGLAGGLTPLGWAACVAGVGLWVWGLWPLRKSQAIQQPPADGIDPSDVQALDVQLARLATALSPALQARLQETQIQLGEALALTRQTASSQRAPSGGWNDDLLYLGQCVRSYLPDTASAYLQVPQSQRVELGADTMLVEQLGLIDQRLTRIKKAAAGAAADALALQQRFLEAKARD